MTICPYCGAEFTPVKRGAHEKRFCKTACKHLYRRACIALAEKLAAGMEPGQLQRLEAALSSRATEPSAETIRDEGERQPNA